MTKKTINVTIEDRRDGGALVYSDDLPGLILSGANRAAILANIAPAATAILRHKGDDSEVVINANFVRASQ